MPPETSLFDQMCAFENLYLAFRKARKGKRGKASAAGFEYNLEAELLSLQRELHTQTWQPGTYRSFFIHDPKRRLISAAPFRDRVVHHALCNLIEPIWEKRFIFDSYANRVGKGTHQAILRCQRFARRYRYVLQCDLEQYFPSIDHQILKSILETHISEARIMHLATQIIDSGAGVLGGVYDMRWFSGDDLLAALRPRGLPIGNLTSQFWANVYLNGFDHFIQREIRCSVYLRYVDDFLLFADDKSLLWAWADAIHTRLGKLRLSLHPPHIFPVEHGIPFLGFQIFPTHRRLKPRKGIAYQRKLKGLFQQWQAGKMERERMDESVRSWAAHAAFGDTFGLRQAVLGKYVLKLT